MNQVATSFSAAAPADFDFSSPTNVTSAAGTQQPYTDHNSIYNNNHPSSSSSAPDFAVQQIPPQASIPYSSEQQPSQLLPQQYGGHLHAFSNHQPSGQPQNAFGLNEQMMLGTSSYHNIPPSHQRYQHQQQQAQNQLVAGQPSYTPYVSNAPYPSASTPAAQVMSADQTQSSTPPQLPPHGLSPSAFNATTLSHPPSATPQQPTPPNKFPMAAPPLPNTPANQAPINGAQAAVQSPRTPQSPHGQSRDHQRITLLLDINVELLQEVTRLQAAGKGGALSPQQQAQLKSQGLPDTIASDEYIQCLRRVQANLSYMGNLAPRTPLDVSKILPGPAIMTPPPHMTRLAGRYDQLRDLFPGWQGHIQKVSQHAINSPNPNGINSSSPSI